MGIYKGAVDYVIAIPSYRRAKTFSEKTGKFLLKHAAIHPHRHIDPKKVYVFLSDPSEQESYQNFCPDFNYVAGRPGMRDNRNYIHDYFSAGQYIVMMDDDLRGIDMTVDARNSVPIPNLHDFIVYGFSAMLEHKNGLWGIHPGTLTIGCQTRLTSDIRFIIGYFFGCINGDIRTTINNKDDYERTILYAERYGGVTRFWNVIGRTQVYGGAGGMQTDPQRKIMVEAEANLLLARYPEYLKIIKRKKETLEIGFRSGINYLTFGNYSTKII